MFVATFFDSKELSSGCFEPRVQGNCARFGIPKGLHSESVLIIALNTVVDLYSQTLNVVKMKCDGTW